MSVNTSRDPAILSYAQALYNAGQKQGLISRMVEESKLLVATLNESANFRVFIEGPQVSPEKKHKVIDNTFKSRLHPIMMNLLYMMIDRERGMLLTWILEEFQEVADRFEGIHPARVSTARELGFQEKINLKAALEKFSGRKLRIDYRVEAALLGGVVFRFGDKLVDASVRHGLNQIRNRFHRREEAA